MEIAVSESNNLEAQVLDDQPEFNEVWSGPYLWFDNPPRQRKIFRLPRGKTSAKRVVVKMAGVLRWRASA